MLDWDTQYNAAQQLVDLENHPMQFLLDIRYATTNNFTNRQVYEAPKCYLHWDTVAALEKVQAALNAQNLSLKIFDGYRPLWSQQLLFNAMPDEQYVSHPSKGGRHTRGTAVDVTLVHSSNLQELPMPTAFDAFTEKAHRGYPNLPPEVIHNRELLRSLMEEIGGFESHPYEWWHFDLKGWQNYTPLNISFSQLMMESQSKVAVL